MISIYKKFHFDAAHFLPLADKKHKCHKLHGHTYHVTIRVSGEKLDKSGWLIDFSEIKKYFKPILKQLDHACLNEIEGLENPTCENLAGWIYLQLSKNLKGISEIHVQETPSSGCIYNP